MIVIENFSLNTTIAGNCDVKIDTQNSGECGLDWAGEMLFLVNINGCSEKVDVDDGSYNGMCYHVPNDDNNLFNS